MGQHGPTSEVKWTTCVFASFVHVVETEGEEGDTVMVERGDVLFSFSTCCCLFLSLVASLLHSLHTLRPLTALLSLHLVQILFPLFFYK